ncbi:kelch-like protein 3 [Metopolophium dirhodum]|uniref:kelch-like protein 3 n=1 Tax=Metopolophium dirhodum TaxID=44670 RepID=UPI00298F7679|nr:kelch-like protein 3 [Metopolophium dirhodum]
MSTKRRAPVIGVLDGVMYAIGGACQELGSSVYLKSVETYSPITKVLSPIKDMHLSRFNSSVVTFKGSFYVIGGSDEFLDSVETYDLKTNTWILEPWPKSLVNVYGAVIFDMPSHLRIY